MSRITIIAPGGVADARLLSAIRGITGESVRAIAEALEIGGPLLELELFSGRVDENFAKVRKLLDVLEAANVQPLVNEDGQPIGAEILRNSMRSSEESAAAFERLSELGHDP